MGEMGSKVGLPLAGIEPRPSTWKADAIVMSHRTRAYLFYLFTLFIFSLSSSMLFNFPLQAMLSLNRHDRLRLINFGSDARAAVRIAILNFYQTKEPEERKYYGAFEYKVYLRLFKKEKNQFFHVLWCSFHLLELNSFPPSRRVKMLFRFQRRSAAYPEQLMSVSFDSPTA